MKRIALIIFAAVLVVPLLLAGPAGAYRITGTQLQPGDSGYGPAPMAVDRAELAQYVAQAQPLYAELKDCAACCQRIDLPTHKCAACATTAACIRRVVARVRLVQTRLARLDVPSQALATDGQLVEAAATMKTSGEYMAALVRSAPQKLTVATFVAPYRGRGGVRIVYRPSPDIVANARFAALRAMGPDGVNRAAFLHARYVGSLETQQYAATGSPGHQAATYLAIWRDGVQRQAAAANLTLPAALTD